MVKEKLIPWTIRNCDEGNFVGMGWINRVKGTLYLDWTRQGNTGWKPSDAARAWAEQKGHLKEKKPRDLKAGLRNAFRSKKEHLVKLVIPKRIAENDGRKRMLWQFVDLKSERERISNPPSKSGQKKKLTTKKSRRDMDEMMMEDNSQSCSSTLSDFEYRLPEPEEAHVKVKSSRKKGGRTKQASTKQSREASKPLPPIKSLIRRCSFYENICDTYQLPLQYQDISSTIPEARFPKNDTESVAFPPKLLLSYPSGPTPPPQKTDVMYDDKKKKSYVSPSCLKSVNYFSYDQCQDSQFMIQSDESRQSPHSSSPLWSNPIHTQSQSSQILNQLDEGSHSPHAISSIWNSPIHTQSQSSQVLNQSDEGSHSPHAISPIGSIPSHYQSQNSQVQNYSDEGSHQSGSHSPHSISPIWNSSIHNQSQSSQVQNYSDEGSHQSGSHQSGSHSPHSISPIWNSPIHNQSQSTQILNQSDGIRNASQSNSPLWLYPSYNEFQITQAPNQPDRICEASPSNPQQCFSPTSNKFQDSVIQSQNTSDERSCDNFLRVTSSSFYTDDPDFPDSIFQFLPTVFPDFLEIPPLEFPQPEEVQGFEAPINDTENIYSQLNIQL